ncbi:MAG: TPM domain-containing protein [Burkholderiales bacterium]|nr:TPM domain-containing protein [Burkholderiales bacterium]
MYKRLLRLFKHRWMDNTGRTLRSPVLQRLQEQVATSEAMHSGEIRICVEAGLPNSYLLQGEAMPVLLRQRALVQFGRLGVWDTEANNGVLIYLCLAERAIELVADRGVNRLVSEQQWSDLVKRLGAALQQGQFESGLSQSVAEVSSILVQHFPLRPGQKNINELPDAPFLS